MAEGRLNLIPHEATTRSMRRILPDPPSNLFTRLIRNPVSASSSPRERPCAEMLASLLINCPACRLAICEWLSTRCGQHPSVSKISRWEIDTEQAIGAKRDDLRIRGWINDGASELAELLWTIEIKVGADFHSSSPNNSGGGVEDDVVNQIVNYDKWLVSQSARVKSGFVLALTNIANEMPSRLTSTWSCLTWTELGSVLKEILDLNELPPEDSFLCRHVLGFIVAHLWRSAEMPDARIEFEDVALLRAMANMKQDCDKKVRQLIEPLGGLFESVGIGKGPWKRRNALFGEWGICSAYRSFTPNPEEWPKVEVGIESDSIGVWIESAPKYSRKDAIRSLQKALAARNPGWKVPDSSWWDLYIGMPLTQLLAAEDQSKFMQEFVTAALKDLMAVNIANVFGK